MSVLIKGMEMPCCCKECIMWYNESSLYGGCLAVSEREGMFDGKTNMEVRQPYCPLVPVPPHGRLIDADALKIMMPTIGDEYLYAREMIEEAPTIIEAEESE